MQNEENQESKYSNLQIQDVIKQLEQRDKEIMQAVSKLIFYENFDSK